MCGAPVVYEDHPSYHNLIGRVEHISEMGTLVTDFSLIKAGALHRANGGYLILDVRSLLQQPFAWQALLRALKARSVKIESLGESLSLISTVSLEPQPIPLDAKVVLLGDRLLYYLLYAYEPGFAELFKVAADFDEHIDRNPENCQRFASFLASLTRHEHTRDLDRTGVARLMEHAARVAEDSEKLSVHARTLTEVLQEADHWAGQERSAVIQDRHVRQAIEQQIQRADRVRQRIYDEIQRGSILIDTEGAYVGQVNGLSLIDLGNFCFGQPSRITATARLGRGEVIDIEREVKLGGALHSKGVLILSSFLASQYASNRPLSLSASLVFEQTYGLVEGDSASLAELCALLSALAGVPVQQSLAVTGSVNQLGQVQAIGGVNQKIEGFFDVCRRRGLSGNQGVLIPRANLPHLMLREDVVEAAASREFRVFAVSTVDEAMSLLTGMPAGQRDAAGDYPEGSVNRRIESRLQELADLRIEFGREQFPAAKAAQDGS
jgi:lon-related putative ATP-dependent protease